jgi:hypothetical protein
MPLARGLMSLGRLTIYQTTTIIDTIFPSVAICGDEVAFNVLVSNNMSSPIPTGGTVSIINTITDTILGTGPVVSGFASIVVTPSVSMGKYIAIYNGVNNLFAESTSSIVDYNVSTNNTLTTVLTSNNLYFCDSQSVPISAHVSAATGPFPSGPVRFRLYSDSTNFIELSPGTLNGSGNATSSISPFTTTGGYDYWLQALYDGYQCWNSSESLAGMSGKSLHSLSNITTNTVVEAIDGSTFCVYNDVIIRSETTSLFGPIADGYIQFTATDGYTIIDLGESIIFDGSGGILVPGGTFEPNTYWNVTAFYEGDGYCYNVSSGNILLHPSTWDTMIDITGPTSFCLTFSPTFDVEIFSISVGTILGTVTLQLLNIDNTGPSFGPFDVNGPNTGVIVSILVPHNSPEVRVGSNHVVATFTPKESNCYNEVKSNNYNVTVLDC